MRERTARLIESLLIALVRSLLPTHGRRRAVGPQPPLVQQRLAAPPRYPVHVCPCERERILQRRRAHWIATYGIDAVPRRHHGGAVSA
ncbi:hypothetical protein [Streptomyces bicolor]|uniref:hypothetical protein n=1 Tax=Streptomyces bicolor TaxID=66874 RepID=UPI000AAEEE9D|nr:hypothetical protein [Streptomyces bicolor]